MREFEKEAGLSAEELELFEYLLEDEGVAETSSAGTIPRRERREDAPLSFAQQRLWFLEQLQPGSAAYNVAGAVWMDGELNTAALGRSLAEIARRHESLRTIFRGDGGRPVQVISPSLDLPLPLADLTTLSERESEAEARRLAREEAETPFDLARGPLLRATLLRLSARRHLLLVTLHHIVSDGWSVGVLVKELRALYGTYSNGEESPLEELAVQYADYAAWQREHLRGERLEAQLEYWRRQLGGELGVLRLPADRRRGAAAAHRGAVESLRIEAGLTKSLKALGRPEGATLYMVLLACWKILLWRYGGEKDVLVGTPVAGRDRAEVEGLIGFFVNTLVLRTDVGGEPSYRELLRRVREVCLEAYAHQDVPFEMLVEELRPERDPGRNPLFQVLFALQNAPLPEFEMSGLHARVEDATGGPTKFDLALEITEDGDELACAWQYDADIFEAATIRRMAAHFRTLLEAIVAAPGARLHELPLLSEGERRRLLFEHNDTRVAYPRGERLHELFEAQAERTPEAVAVVSDEASRLSYDELNRRANHLAHYLRGLGLRPEARVGVLLERSTELVVALLGVLKAGGVCVPLDPAYPPERLRLLLEDSGACVLLTDEALAERLPEGGARVVCLDALAGALRDESERNPSSVAESASVAYVIYTSGSTGRPKGVMVTHGALCNHMRWMRDAFEFDATDRVLQKTPIGFDASVWEFYAPLLRGARLVLARPGGQQDSAYLVRAMNEHGVTVLQVVPTLLRMLVSEPDFGRCESLRLIFCGGEVLTEELAARCRGRLPRARLCNLYGPAEATIDATFHEYEGTGGGATVPVGRPVANVTAYVLDDWLCVVPEGVAGELYIGGAGLARGYEGRAGLTAERFVPHPYAAEPGARLYRTGDVVRRLAGGELEFLGREDGQVKVRGSRVELGEVEAALCGHAWVRAAAVAARDDASGERRLVAYVVTDEGRERVTTELREYLKARLPVHAVPAAFVRVERLPLLPSGKVDRRQLPAPDRAAYAEAGGYRAPRTPVEEALCGIWSQLLGVERVGIQDNFFELGGHSLLATQVVSRVRETLSVELPLGRLFRTPELAGLAEFVELELRGGGEQSAPTLRPASRREAVPLSLPLSFAQRRLWFLEQLEPGSPLYNTPGALHLKGRLDVSALARALSEIVRRHEILRTTFDAPQGGPVQIISPPRRVRVPLIDLSERSEAERAAEARRLMIEEARLPFNLPEGPLLRATLLRLDEDEHVLLFTMHHIVSDGWSVGVLVRETAALYGAYSNDEESPLEELAVQYADYAAWQREWLRGERLEAQLAYWRAQLAGLPPVLELPADRPRPKVMSLRGESLPVEFSEELTRGLKALGRREGVTLFMTLLAAFQTLLSRYAGQPDVAVGVPVANRGRREVEDLIGFFVNTLVLRTDLSGDPTFRELLGRVREVSLGAYAHQDVPFEMLVEELRPERGLSHTPLFQVLFVLQNAPGVAPELPGLAVEQLEVGSGTAKFDLMLSLEESEEKLRGVFEYSTDMFDEATARRMLDHLGTLLEGVTRRPESRISELPLLTAEEEQQLLVGWNSTAADFPRGRCIQDLFAEQAARTPDETALVFGDERLSYRELNERANQLAHFLRREGVGPETVVAVATGRSTLMAVSVLAVLKAGGAYMPLDPHYPRERLSFMLEDTRARVVLTEEHLAARLPAHAAHLVRLDAERDLLARESGHDPVHGATEENLAYVIYTSGSTGRPKAVVMAHRSLCNLVAFQSRSSRANGGRPRTLQFASLNFDVSFQEMFSTWCAGAALVVVGEETRRDAGELLRVLEEERIERLFLPFVALQHLAETSEAEGRVPRHLREVITAGEQLKITPHIERLFGRLEDCVLDNHYGPTETHLATMWRLRGVAAQWPKLPPIGEPVSNAQVYVLDARWRPVPLGVVGELYVGGEGLARGYLNRPAQTAERFIPHPFGGAAGARLYRTGDLVRRFADGRLEYVGRGDRQVKVRGFRVEVGEVEATLKLHGAVRQAAVTDWEDEAGRKRLAAYVVAATDAPQTLTGELKRLLRERLPEYMVPAAFVRVERLPLLPSGKVDRRALPAPDRAERDEDGRYRAPRTPVEEALCGIWGEVLGREAVGADDDFFELGGHSLLATQLMSRVRRTFQVEVALRRLFEHPTPAGLAEIVEAEMRAGREPLPPVHRVARERSAPLSFAQQRLWFLDKLEPDSAAYNLPSALRMEGPLDVAALERSLDEILRRHEVLRTTFAIVDGEPAQLVAPHVRTGLSLVDLTTLPEREREAEARRLAREEAETPFDLAAGPLLRAALLRLDEGEHVLLVTLHHIVSDGWSMGVLVKELRALYEAYARGEESPLEELAVQYADYAAWQREHLRGERLAAQLEYWRAQLAGLPPALELPADRPRPRVPSLRGASVPVELSGELTRGLKALGRREGATLFMTLLAAFDVLLSRYTGQSNIAVGTPVANRGRGEVEDLIGFFVNTLVLRTDLSGDPTFRELLGRVREVSLGAYAHQDAPFEMLVEELRPERDLGRTPLFQVLFALQNAPPYELALPNLKLSVSEVENPAARFELALEMSETASGGLDCRFTYDAELFDAATIARMAEHFRNLLQGIASDPEQRVSAVEMLREDERRQLLFDWNSTRAEYPRDLCIHELFEAQAAATPEAAAVVCGAVRLSYRELNERANQYAHLLRGLGAGPETLIGICVERSAEMVVGLLGVLKAGAAYVPLAPGSPRARLEMVLKDAGIELLLTQRRLADELPAGVARVVQLDGGLFEQESVKNPSRAAVADNLAYVIYTSGSTGRPKGVEVTHRNLVHSTTARLAYYDEPVRSFVLVSPFVFDSSVAGIFWTLCSGGRLVLPAEDFQRDLTAFAALIERESVSHLLCLPSLYTLLLRQAAPDRLGGLRCVIAAGEPCPAELPARHFEALPGAHLFNEYGPTEGTVWSSVYECEPRSYETTVPIGRPVSNVQAYVLDARLNLVPIGVAGELYIGGGGLARGYLRRAGFTAERFVPHPFGGEPGARLYRTGDLVRRLTNGDMEFLGRRDGQVKVRGYRIELGEVEAALRAHPSVREAVVTLREEIAGDARLVGYLTAGGPDAPTTEDLRDFLRERLPDYMLPSVFVVLDALPVTASGKPDRRALPAPGASRPTLAASFAAPQTPLEKTVAEVWREFLRLETIGVNDNFFELGGHSLLLVLVHEKLRERLGREVPIADMFRFPTVRALARHLGQEPGRKDESALNRRRAGARQEALRARSRTKTEGQR